MSDARSSRHLVVLWILLLGGCSSIPAGSPYTETRLSNETDAPLDVELVIDPRAYGLDASDDPRPLARGWLEEYADGDGVEVVELDVGRLTGRYRVKASGFMVVHASLGTKPYFRFWELRLEQDGRSVKFRGRDELNKVFAPTGAENRFTFVVTADRLR